MCIGGIYPNSVGLKSSIPYTSDEFTWCVQKAKLIPKYLRICSIAPPEVWCGFIFVYGYGSGFILYLLIQFDKNYAERNNRCWHYTTWLIALPAAIGFSQRSGSEFLHFRHLIIKSFFIICLGFNQRVALCAYIMGLCSSQLCLLFKSVAFTCFSSCNF